MMQALESLQSPEEKIAALCKKYADLLQQQKVVQKQLRASQKKQVCNEILSALYTIVLFSENALKCFPTACMRRSQMLPTSQMNSAWHIA